LKRFSLKGEYLKRFRCAQKWPLDGATVGFSNEHKNGRITKQCFVFA